MQNIFTDVKCLEAGLVIMEIHCLCMVEINISLLCQRVGSINLQKYNKGTQFSYFFVFRQLRKCNFSVLTLQRKHFVVMLRSVLGFT
jgi:hypothetical protein